MSFSSDQPQLSNQLPLSIDFPENPELFLETLGLTYKRIVDSTNTKIGGLFLLQQMANFERWFKQSDTAPFTIDTTRTRNGYRNTLNMIALNGGPIASGATINVPHGIPLTNDSSITRIFGGARSTGPFFLPIPYAPNPTALNTSIEVFLDLTTITLHNGAGQNQLNQVFIVVEYLQEVG